MAHSSSSASRTRPGNERPATARPRRDRERGDPDGREIVGYLDDAEEITADGDEGGVFLLALGVLALEPQREELAARLADVDRD